MTTLLVTAAILFHLITTAAPFKCYLCKGGLQASFQECNQDLEIQTCPPNSNQNPHCGIFSFNDNATGNRLYGKSCVLQSYCEDTAFFCRRGSSQFTNGTAMHCELECCSEELCNFHNENDDAEDGCDWVESTANPSLMASRFSPGACVVYVIAMTIRTL